MNGFDEPSFDYGSNKGWKRKARKADLKEWAEQGQNWALEELGRLRQAEMARNRERYERFKEKRTPGKLRAKWRQAKAEQRAVKAEAAAKAKKRQLEIEELAATATATAAPDAERERKAELGTSGTVRELKVIRAVANPRLILCAYWQDREEYRCLVNVGRNRNFVPRMTLRLTEPSDSTARCRPWPYAGPLPRRKGRW